MTDPRTIREALAGLVDEGVALAVWGADLHEAPELEDEAVFVEGAIERRRLEFKRGRACAREAMAGLGGSRVAIPVGARREPVWPDGFVGAISHSGEVIAAVVAREEEFAGVGLDVERAVELKQGVERLILTEDERAEAPASEPWRSALRFSAKECLYKAVFPTVRRWIGFREVEVELDAGSFVARYVGRKRNTRSETHAEAVDSAASPDAPPGLSGDGAELRLAELVSSFRGFWEVAEGYVITFGVLPRG